MTQNQPLLYGDAVRDRTLEEVVSYLRGAKNIGKIVSATIGINQVLNDECVSILDGDVYTGAVPKVAGWFTPVLGGVGPATVAVLMRNATIAHKRQQLIGWA